MGLSAPVHLSLSRTQQLCSLLWPARPFVIRFTASLYTHDGRKVGSQSSTAWLKSLWTVQQDVRQYECPRHISIRFLCAQDKFGLYLTKSVQKENLVMLLRVKKFCAFFVNHTRSLPCFWKSTVRVIPSQMSPLCLHSDTINFNNILRLSGSAGPSGRAV